MKKYNYCLIISQYYHSRHSFVVEFPEDFTERCKEFIMALEDYKRENKEQPYRFGDIGYHSSEDTICRRYNVNDAGDIYFINSNSINELMGVAEDYFLTSYKESRPYQRKEITHNIYQHHKFDEVQKIVEQYFNIL